MYWNITDKERLATAFTLTNTLELSEKFLCDLLTEKERKTCIMRLKAACLIKDGVSYRKIYSITGLSPNTIARLSKKMANREGGFQKIIEKFSSKGKPYFD